ncbi:helix-turn-helix domain-containing protein [Bacillus carboniphilus]|uniref:helix-turn-helix domain-containing protein n=1 Tax=Bacillus carboniphilus TaxID=86663 RepID=UPI003531F754
MIWKDRTKFGRWLDQNEISQIDLEKVTNLSRGTISSICNNENYRPKYSTICKIENGLKKLGKEVDMEKLL